MGSNIQACMDKLESHAIPAGKALRKRIAVKDGDVVGCGMGQVINGIYPRRRCILSRMESFAFFCHRVSVVSAVNSLVRGVMKTSEVKTPGAGLSLLAGKLERFSRSVGSRAIRRCRAPCSLLQ